jgi:hypothetical protein
VYRCLRVLELVLVAPVRECVEQGDGLDNSESEQREYDLHLCGLQCVGLEVQRLLKNIEDALSHGALLGAVLRALLPLGTVFIELQEEVDKDFGVLFNLLEFRAIFYLGAGRLTRHTWQHPLQSLLLTALHPVLQQGADLGLHVQVHHLLLVVQEHRKARKT